MKPSESAIIDDNTTVSDCCNDEIMAMLAYPRNWRFSTFINPNYMLSQYQVFETVESRGDTKHIVFDIFSPSILFSEF
jgi:hypothetical protein